MGCKIKESHPYTRIENYKIKTRTGSYEKEPNKNKKVNTDYGHWNKILAKWNGIYTEHN